MTNYSLLIGNREVRAYLQSNFRVKRIINEKAPAESLVLLNKELKIRFLKYKSHYAQHKNHEYLK